MLFFSLKAIANRGEQGESNAEGMGCTQHELQQPCSLTPRHSRFILVFKQKWDIRPLNMKCSFHSTVRISGPPSVM